MDIKRNGRNAWLYNSEIQLISEKLKLNSGISGQQILKALLVDNEIKLSPIRQITSRTEKNLPEDSDLTSELEKEKKTEIKADTTKNGDKLSLIVEKVKELLKNNSKEIVIENLKAKKVTENGIKTIFSEIEKSNNLFDGLL